MIFHSLLLIDIGNTRTKWAIAPRLGESRIQTPLRIKGELATTEVNPDFFRRLKTTFSGHYPVLSSVVPKAVPLFARTFKRNHHVVRAESAALGLRFDYPKPKELGADRLAAAVAIHAEGKFPAIIVACGTATAFTVLDMKGRLCGGAIAPGLQAQFDALLLATAQLPVTKLRDPKSALAKSTREAIRSGVVLNFRGGIERIISELSAALPGRERPRIVLTGGNASLLAGSLEMSHTLRPLLVLEGLHIIGERILNPLRQDK